MRNKIIAIFQILVFIFSIFSIISFNSTNAEAAQACCEKIQGKEEYCQNVDDSLCDKTFKYAATSCDQTSFCKTGCCFNPGEDGLCYSNYPKTKCDVNKGVFDGTDSSCSSSAQCQEGCCVIGTEAFFVTEARCKSETKKFPDLQMDFRNNVKTEVECINVARSSEKGACVKNSNDCKYTTRSACSAEQTATTGFFSDKYCSQLAFVNCAPPDKTNKRGHTGCLGDSEDVYWFDSCGNPEDVAEDCDYIDGSLCGDSDNDKVYSCEDLNCKDNDKYLSLNLDDYAGSDKADVLENGVNNGESWCLFDDKEQGVEYGARDRPGSRFYRSICINGKEIVDECADFRKEWCVDGAVEVTARIEGKDEQREFHEARCRENRWQSCIDSCNTLKSVESADEGKLQEAFRNDFECCLNSDIRDCRWIGPGGAKQVKPFGAGKFGSYCVPQVKPGFKTWEQEGSNTCGKANLECEAAFRCPGVSRLLGMLGGNPCANQLFSSGESWEVVYGSECLKEEWIQSANDLCRSMGDCGADVNLNNKITFSGFSNTPIISKDFRPFEGPGFLEDSGLSKDRGGQWWDFSEEKDKGKMERFFNDKASLIPFSIAVSLGLSYAIIGKWSTSGASWLGLAPKGTFTQNFFAPFSKGTGLGLGSYLSKIPGISKLFGGKGAEKFVLKEGTSTLFENTNWKFIDGKWMSGGIEAGDADLVNKLTQQATNEGTALQSATGSPYATALKFVSAAMWIWTAYQVIDLIMEKEEKVTITTTCKDWVAPTPTGSACELCNPEEYQKNVTLNNIEKTVATDLRGLLECSEYKCKSFGQACELINKGTDHEKCITKDIHDVKSPKLLYWKDGTDSRLQVEDKGVIGYEIKNDIPAYERFFIGIKTDEPAQCKMSFNHSIKYDQMNPYYFGDSLYGYFHTQLLTYPKGVNATKSALTLGAADNKYKIYVRCEDALGNDNEKDFVIDFKIGKGADLTAPVVEYSSIGKIPGETYIAAGTNETSLSLFVNEPAECRWDTSDVDYDTMSSDHECRTTACSTCGGLFECKFDKDARQGNSGPKLKGLADKELIYIYLKCKDQFDNCINGKDIYSGMDCTRNKNKDSYDLTLRRSQYLNITSVEPNATIFIGGVKGNITLKAETNGGALKNGNAYCGYTTDDKQKSNVWAMNAFFNTNSSKHTQVLTPATGTFTYYVGCADLAGNTDYKSTTFTVQLDTKGPEITRAYDDQSTMPSLFKIEVDEPAVCKYNNEKKFNFDDPGANLMQEDGLVHSAASGFNTYYVLCRDQYGNIGDISTITFFL